MKYKYDLLLNLTKIKDIIFNLIINQSKYYFKISNSIFFYFKMYY